MRRSNKHNVQRINFSNLIGGINISQAPEQIGEAEMQVCKNFIYERDSKRLTGRGGLSEPIYQFRKNIKSSWYDVDMNVLFFVLEDESLWSVVSGQEPNEIGTLTGESIPMFAKFQDKVWIASGNLLQYYDYDDIYTVTSSPTCDITFQRFSRLAVGLTGTDRITFSAVGDGTSWENITDSSQGPVDSSAAWLDVGYGDSGDILSIIPLSTDLLFIKSNGMIYQLTGDALPESWTVTRLATDTDPIGKDTAKSIGQSVIYLSRRGLKTLATTMDYGNIATSDIGDKFNGLLTNEMWEPQMFNMRRHSTLMIRPTEDKTYFVAYNYLLGCATEIDFGVPVTSITETVDEVYVCSGKDVMKWSDEYLTDNGKAINYEMMPRDVIGTEEMLVKSVDTKFSSDHAGEVKLTTGKLSVTMPTNTRRKVKCNHSTACISLDVKSNDRFILDHIVLEVADL